MSEQDEKVARYAEAILSAVHEDMRYPLSDGKQIPADVGSFSALHNFCDANMYCEEFIPVNGPECTCPVNRNLQQDHSGTCATQGEEYRAAWDAHIDMCNLVTNEVDKRLAAEADELRAAGKADLPPIPNGTRVVYVSDSPLDAGAWVGTLGSVAKSTLHEDGWFGWLAVSGGHNKMVDLEDCEPIAEPEAGA